MLKTIIFQLHWLLGITAGTVLAVMGLSGATLAFEDEIMRAANPALAQVVQRHAAGEQPLALTELLPRLQQGMPQPLQRLRVDATGQRLSVARFEGGQANWRYFDPYTGTVLTGLKGLDFFAFVEDLHRHLVSGERGSLITGSCAIALVFFCLSGLYLRWPRRWWHWRTWLAVEWARSGRSFLWSLHSVVGTWVLLVYLMIALTGLWWSFDWYRKGATALLGGPTAEQTAPRTRGGPLDLHKVQTTLYALEGVRRGYIDLRFPAKPGRALTSRVQGSNTAHDRAQDILQLDPSTGALLSYEPYRSKTVGGKIIVSVFALHSGSFFGLPGRIIVMLSSLGMLVFFITGWMLYLDRRRKKRDVRASRLPLATAIGTGQPWLVAFASQSGFAEQLAWRTAAQLQAAGLPVHVRPLGQGGGTPRGGAPGPPAGAGGCHSAGRHGDRVVRHQHLRRWRSTGRRACLRATRTGARRCAAGNEVCRARARRSRVRPLLWFLAPGGRLAGGAGRAAAVRQHRGGSHRCGATGAVAAAAGPADRR